MSAARVYRETVAVELLGDVVERGRRADVCPFCATVRGCSHAGDCLVELASLWIDAFDSADDLTRTTALAELRRRRGEAPKEAA